MFFIINTTVKRSKRYKRIPVIFWTSTIVKRYFWNAFNYVKDSRCVGQATMQSLRFTTGNRLTSRVLTANTIESRIESEVFQDNTGIWYHYKFAYYIMLFTKHIFLTLSFILFQNWTEINLTIVQILYRKLASKKCILLSLVFTKW